MNQPPGPWGPPPPYPPPPYGGPPPYPYGGGPPAPPRPATLTTAGVITVALGVLGVLAGLGIGLLIAVLGSFAGQVSESKSPGEGDGVTAFFVAVALGFVVVTVGLSVAYLLLGVRVLRGGSAARVVLTVWNALGVLAALAWIGLGAASALSASPDGGGVGEAVGPVVWALAAAGPATVVLVLLWTRSASAYVETVSSLRR